MAKKKSETKSESTVAASIAPVAKKKATKAVKAKVAAPVAAALAPMVDTRLAAQAAARMLTAKASGLSPSAPVGERKETAAFRQLKQSFNKPHAAGVGNILNSTASSETRKSNQPFQNGKQPGNHNQTFGSDASKNFVPRRTGG